MQKHIILVSLTIYLSFLVLGTSSEPRPQHFVLARGASHAGHNVTAIDLAASGIDPQQENTLRSISDYI
ncbi:hypothetical protein QQP08_006041 [Theobroma cacao]|nr:hypothetical protein QQP08_006041 [Theobroma cacao]